MKRVLGVVVAMAMVSVGSPTAHADPVRLSLPVPTGRHRVGTTSLHLVDGAREDALAPTARPRELMVRLWYPAARSQAPRAGYLTPGHSAALVEQLNAAAGTGYPAGLLTFSTHSGERAPADGTRHPIVLLSPGYGGNAGWHTGLAEELASRGYVMAAMDHTFDVAVVEFPDGRLEPLATDEIADRDQSIATRAADTSFVLDQLTAIAHGHNPDFEHRRLPAGLDRALDVSRVAGLGFSRGSSATVVTMAVDRRVDAGIALDGNPLGTFTFARPFLMFGNRERHLPDVDADWAAFHDRLTGPRLWAVVDGMKHNDFTDLTVFKAVIDPNELLSVGIAVGSIDGERSLLVQRRYVTAWLDLALRDRHDRLLSGESSDFPEVDFQP